MKKDCARAEIEQEWYVVSVIVLESENGNKGTLHLKRVRQRKKILTLRKKRCIQGESRVALHLLTDLAHFLKLFRPPLCHLLRYLHVVIYLHISARGILCACVFLVWK